MRARGREGHMAGRKRARSLEERLAAIRTAPESEPDAPADPPAAETHPGPVIVAELVEDSETAEPQAREPEPEPEPEPEREPDPPAAPEPLFPAAEGDTFLPGSAAAANRVDVGVAVQAAVRQLWPELDQAEKPVELAAPPEETPLLSKLLGRSRTSSTRHRAARASRAGIG